MGQSIKTLLVLGGTSDIGRATACAFAEDGWATQLAGRDEEALAREANDISIRTGAVVTTHFFDVLATDSFATVSDLGVSEPDPRSGDRGRASNYVYGAGKAGFTAFLSGLRNRRARQGIHVVTVKPGFVRTRMTANMSLPAALLAEPTAVAKRIQWAALTGQPNRFGGS